MIVCTFNDGAVVLVWRVLQQQQQVQVQTEVKKKLYKNSKFAHFWKIQPKKILFRYNKFRFSGQCPVTGQRPVDIFSVELYINLIFIYFG